MASAENTTPDSRSWATPLVRAVPLALLAIVITFSADHSARFGLVSFGAFAVLTGLLLGGLELRPSSRSGMPQAVALALAGVTLLSGIVALLVPSTPSALFLVLLAWGAISGFLELYAGLKARGRHPAARDWTFLGALTALFALVVLVIPPDYSQQYAGPDGVARVLDSSIVVVGALGAYGAIAAVYLVIAALSLKWAPTPVTQDGIRR